MPKRRHAEHDYEMVAWQALSSMQDLFGMPSAKKARYDAPKVVVDRRSDYTPITPVKRIFEYPMSTMADAPLPKKIKMAKVRSKNKKYSKNSRSFSKSSSVKVKKMNYKRKNNKKSKKYSKRVNPTEKTTNAMFHSKKMTRLTKGNVFKMSLGAKRLMSALKQNDLRAISGVYENQAAGFLKSDWESNFQYDFVQFLDNRLFCADRSQQKTNSKILEFFSPEWVKQAHDVLYAGAGATHEPVALANSDDDLKKEIFVHSAHGHVYLKNDTCEPKRVTFYFCKPKTRGTNDIVSDLEEHIGDARSDGTLISPGGAFDNNYYKNRFDFSPSWISGFTKDWTITKEEVLMEPGSRYDFVVKGPQNVSYVFKKWQDETTPGPTFGYYKYINGYGLYTFYTVANVEVRGTIPPSTYEWQTGGSYAPTISTGYKKSWTDIRTVSGIVNQDDVIGLRQGVTCRIKHYIKVSPASIVHEGQRIKGKFSRNCTGVQQTPYSNFGVDRVDPRVLGQVDYNPSGRAPGIPGTDGV